MFQINYNSIHLQVCVGHIILKEQSSPWPTARLQADSEVAKHQLAGAAGPSSHTSELAEFLIPSRSHVSAELRESVSISWDLFRCCLCESSLSFKGCSSVLPFSRNTLTHKLPANLNHLLVLCVVSFEMLNLAGICTCC